MNPPEQLIEEIEQANQREKQALEYLIHDAQETGDTQKIADALVALKNLSR